MTKRILFGTLTAVGLLASALSAQAASDPTAAIREQVLPKIQTWLKDAAVIAAVKDQNQKHAALSQAEIDELDKKWRAETKGGDKTMINGVLGNALSAFLKKIKDDAQGMYTEIFVMDAKGLNVGQSDVTSDYWQGDEAKWQKTYLVGADASFIDEVEFDESTQTYQSQVSLPVVDESGAVIGAVTVGVNVEAIQ